MINGFEEDLGHADEISRLLQALQAQPERPRPSPRPAPDRPPGSSFGPYRLLSLLGRGAFGVVYRASDGSRELAIKILNLELHDGERAATIRARFEREGRLSEQIEHPHVVKTYGFGEHEGTLYMACELLSGGSIADLLERGTLTEHRALTLAAQVLKALIALEDHALIHRDIKPANILLDAAGRAKVSDLGLVRSTSPGYTLLTGAGLTVGTPSYMAPEQIMGSPDLDIRCDLYALGATLFHMLTGRPPFLGSSSHEVVQAHLNQQLPEIELLASEIHAETAALIRRLLQKGRSRRPSSAGEALRAVEKILAALGDRPSNLDLQGAEPEAGPVVEEQALEAMATAELLAPYEAEELEEPLSKAALRVRGAPGEATLFAFAGRTLVLGRGIWASLRLSHRSAIAPERLDERISPRHARLRIVGDRAEVSDLVSSFGTSVDQRRIAAGQAQEIEDFAPIILGGTLQLNALKVAPPSGRSACVKGAGLTARGAPALYLTRPFDGPEHSYALIPGRLRLAVSAAGELTPDPRGPIELLNVEGALWGRDLEADPDRSRRLTAGSSWSVGGAVIEVEALDEPL